MGALLAKESDWIPEYKVGEVRSLSIHGGPTANNQRGVEMPQGRQLPHPTKLPDNSWETEILRQRHKYQSGNARDIKEVSEWVKAHNAGRWIGPQGERRVKFIV